MSSSIRIPSIVITISLLISACSLHQIDKNPAPEIESEEQYPSAPSSETESYWDLNTPWWYSFNRQELNDFIEQSFSANQNIVQAVARVEQARAIVVQTRSFRLPEVSAIGFADQRWEDNDTGVRTADIGGLFTWEIDLFNRIGSAVTADTYEAQASAEDLEALRLSLSAEVADAYFGSVAAQRRIDLLHLQVQLDQELLDLLELRLEYGVGTTVDVLQQKSQLADSESLIPTAEAIHRVFENRLDVLLGIMPDGKNRVSETEDLSFMEQVPAVGVPSDLLLRRPDLRSAQASLVASDADIGAAIADRLPRITLDGSYLYSDIESFSRQSFTGPVGIIAATFIQPLLDWGRRKAEVERNRALYVERLAAYTQLYLEAVEEVENALYQERKQRDFIKRLEARRDILQATVNETEELYFAGVDDYLPVLDALQELREVERDLITQRLALVSFRIRLYRAIGGPVYPENSYTKKGKHHAN